MKTEQKEYNFLKELNNFLDGRLLEYKDKVKVLQNITEVKQDILDVIDRVLPEDYTNKIITKSKREDEVRSQMFILEHEQSLLREKVNRILNNPKLHGKSAETRQLIIDKRQGRIHPDGE